MTKEKKHLQVRKSPEAYVSTTSDVIDVDFHNISGKHLYQTTLNIAGVDKLVRVRLAPHRWNVHGDADGLRPLIKQYGVAQRRRRVHLFSVTVYTGVAKNVQYTWRRFKR